MSRERLREEKDSGYRIDAFTELASIEEASREAGAEKKTVVKEETLPIRTNCTQPSTHRTGDPV